MLGRDVAALPAPVTRLHTGDARTSHRQQTDAQRTCSAVGCQTPAMTDPSPHERVTSAEDEKAAERRLTTVLAPRIDALVQRHHTRPTVVPGSSLYGDDQASKPYHLSHAAWHPINHAIDNLHALRSLTVRGDLPDPTVHTHTYAAYPLIRAAFENASQSVWLLGDPNRNERLTRRFRLLLTDGDNGDAVTRLNGSEPGLRAAWLAGVQPIAEQLGLEGWAKVVRYKEIVRRAAEALGGAPDSAHAFWSTLSGLTHGDLWASLAVTDRHVVADTVDGVAFNASSSVATITDATEYAVTVAERAVRLYDQRCTPIA